MVITFFSLGKGLCCPTSNRRVKNFQSSAIKQFILAFFTYNKLYFSAGTEAISPIPGPVDAYCSILHACKVSLLITIFLALM
jgi:hypothetical protein